MTNSNYRKLVFHGTVGAFIVKGLAAVAGLGMNVALARALSLSDFGVVALGLSWLTITGAIACFGTDTVSLRFVAQARATGDAATVSAVMRWGRNLTLSLGGVVAVLSWVLIWPLFTDMTPEQRFALCGIVLATPMLALALNRASVIRGAKRAVLAAVVEMLLRPVTILLLVTGLAWVLAGSVSVLIMAGAVVVGHGVMMLAGVWASHPMAGAKPAPSAERHREWLQVAKPIALMNIMIVVIGNVDTLLVGYFVDADSAGIYRASAQLANLVSFGLAASNGIIAPLIAELYSQGKREELTRVLRFSVALVASIGVGGAVFMGVAGQWALGLFGAEYTAGYTALLILLASQAVNALCGPTGLMMSMTGHQTMAARIFAGSAVLSVVLNLLLIPWLGIVGAALANLCGLVAWNLAILVFVRQRLALDPSIMVWMSSGHMQPKS